MSAVRARVARALHRPAAFAVATTCAVVVAVVFAMLMPAMGVAATQQPHWAIISTSAPTYFKPGDQGDFYEIIAVNDGGAPTDGSPFVVAASLPSDVTATASYGDAILELHGLTAQGMSCPTTERCESVAVVPAGELVKMKILVTVSPQAAGELRGSVTISGGGAAPATADITTTVSSAKVPFGASLTSDIATSAGIGQQAGSHPEAFTTILALNVSSVNKTEICTLITSQTPGCALLNSDVKDLEVPLPPGLIGDPTAMPRCSQAAFQEIHNNNCPADTQVGVMHLGFYGSGTILQYAPVYNVEPPPGQPAELGFTVGGLFHIPMYFRADGERGYALDAQLAKISEADPVHFGALTIWGQPALAIHDLQREGTQRGTPCELEGCSIAVDHEAPFLRLPTSCSSNELEIGVSGDSWQEPGTLENLPLLAVARIPAMIGCEALSFAPSVEVKADTLQAGVPASYGVQIDVPQNPDAEGLATSDVRDVELTLPQGTVVSPAAANGLSACSEQQFELRVARAGHCPSQAKIGQVSITTPLLEAPLRGSVFLGSPECAPCSAADAQAGKMVPLLIEAEGSGVVIKLAGHTRIDQSTGQLTTVFTENPQLPFSTVEVALKGGDNAPLVNPAACGDAVAVAKLTPWSSMTATDVSAPPLPISGCSVSGFNPVLSAGAAKAQAGAFTGFSLTLSRADGQQKLSSVVVHMPPGLLGMLSRVEQCDEARANAGTCPAGSEIGTASATVGSGSQPLTIGGGKVYLTGPYQNSPFGLSIVTPTEAGPFQLAGNTGGATEVVRAAISVDSHTGAVSVSSDALPNQLEGVPLDIRAVEVDIDRAGFMFNPTNCDALSIAGTVKSTTGTSADVAFPFQAVNCAKLPFKPRFSVSTQAKTSKSRGASLHVKVTSGQGQANIGKVKVDLPKQLPSRLATLQKACVASVFESNPAKCPAASVVGTSRAVTPVLNAPLVGPAYLVSHGGAAFPDLEIVLQGQGVTLILDGATRIKKGITSSTFRSVPDAPISTFDLTLPEGPHSVLATNLPVRAHHSMCGQKLTMPTVLTGQNGAVIEKSTVISVAGCQTHRSKTR